jgi:hypothetical protein
VARVSQIVERVRLELGDMPKQFTYSAPGTGTLKDFDSKIKPVEPSSLVVEVRGPQGTVPIPSPAGYTVEKDLGIFHFWTAPAANATVTITGLSYRYFTDSDLERFVNTAVEQHTHERMDAYGRQMTVGNLPTVEEYPIAILAAIEGLWALATDAAFDIDIQAPDGVMIPRSERYRQLSQIIQQRMQQYKELSSALNIGLWRLEMGTLRRVSRHTNRLVPIYMAQEIEDSKYPQRVYIENNLKGFDPTPTTAAIYDLLIYQGDLFTIDLDFPSDTTNLVFKAQIRVYAGAPIIIADMTVTVINNATGRIRLSLPKAITKNLPKRGVWDLQATSTIDDTFQKTYMRGQVFVTEQVTVDI